MTKLNQISVQSAREGAGYIIGSLTTDSHNGTTFSIADKPVVHPTASAARAEAERLARAYPGKYFVPLRLSGAVIAQGVNWS